MNIGIYIHITDIDTDMFLTRLHYAQSPLGFALEFAFAMRVRGLYSLSLWVM